MAIKTTAFVQYLDKLLQPEKFKDYCPNGLQIQGNHTINKVMTAVSATQESIEHAIEQGADALLVHHGYFWKGEQACITGMKHKRIRSLLEHNINLIAYHLPLDCHEEFGNNVQLAKLMGWKVEQSIEQGLPKGLVLKGKLDPPVTAGQLAHQFSERLHFTPLLIGDKDRLINELVWCTGAAQGYVQHAINCHADAFITGEISENTVHQAKENDIHYFACGHHATERYGVQALGQHLAQHFNIEHVFIDCPVPV